MPFRRQINGDDENVFFNEEEKAFDFFFRRYYSALCFFGNSIIRNEDETKDIVQNCFIKLWDSHSFLDRPETVKSFLYSSVKNACIDFIRKKEVREKAKSDLLTTQSENDSEYFDEVAFAEMMRQILDRVHELPITMQTVLKMFYLDGKKYGEIARTLNTSPDAVRMQKNRAIKIIRRKLLFFTQFFFF